MVPLEAGVDGGKEDVLTVSDGGSAVSLEFVPLREGIGRAFLRNSPRSPNLSQASVNHLIEGLTSRPYNRILLQDSRKGLIARLIRNNSSTWRVGRAIPDQLSESCSMVTTYDLPLGENLVDSAGLPPDLTRTSHMSGIEVPVSGRKGWAFFTEEGDQARIISEEERRQGLLVASRTEDLFVVTDCLIRYLASIRKSWAVFSMDMGRFIRRFDPITMIRMSLDRPKGFEHTAVPYSNANKGELLRLFSEYYDESVLQSRFRLRKFRSDKNYTIFTVPGGFVIDRLEGDTGLIYDIYVSPAHQGKGLGRELLKCSLTDFSGKVSSCYLHTSYPRAKRLYERFGFKAVYSQLGIRLDEITLERKVK